MCLHANAHPGLHPGYERKPPLPLAEEGWGEGSWRKAGLAHRIRHFVHGGTADLVARVEPGDVPSRQRPTRVAPGLRTQTPSPARGRGLGARARGERQVSPAAFATL